MTFILFALCALTAFMFALVGSHYVRMPRAGLTALIIGAVILSVSLFIGVLAGHSIEDLVLLSDHVNGQFVARYGMAIGLLVSGLLLFFYKK